jgi:glycine/D-amino acid oxidase-like deaminating enzyme
MSQRTETVVIGAGPAGLSCSQHLTQRQHEHLVLEQGRIAETWRTHRWDGFRLNTPSFCLDLPGCPYDGDDPDGFLTRDETVAYLERYAAGGHAPVRAGVRVLNLRRRSGRFVLQTSDGRIDAENVVVATGAFQRPTPRPAGGNPPRVLQQTATGPTLAGSGCPVFDRAGWPVQRRGVTAVRGLYFVGLPWLHKRKSALLLGVGEDAEYVVSTIVGDPPRARRMQ